MIIRTATEQFTPIMLRDDLWSWSHPDTIVNSPPIAKWNDASGNNRDWDGDVLGNTGPTILTSALNGFDGLRFDGSNDRMPNDDSDYEDLIESDYTLFMIFKYGSVPVTGQGTVFHIGNSSGNDEIRVAFHNSVSVPTPSTVARVVSNGSDLVGSGSNGKRLGPVSATTYGTLTIEVDHGTSFQHYVNGSSKSLGATRACPIDSGDHVKLCQRDNNGSSTYFGEVDFIEWIAVAKILSTAQRELVENYLRNKYRHY